MTCLNCVAAEEKENSINEPVTLEREVGSIDEAIDSNTLSDTQSYKLGYDKASEIITPNKFLLGFISGLCLPLAGPSIATVFLRERTPDLVPDAVDSTAYRKGFKYKIREQEIRTLWAGGITGSFITIATAAIIYSYVQSELNHIGM